MPLQEGQVRLAISITAHEELDTLLAQVRNLRWFCDEPLIVVHLNEAFFARIEEDATLRRALRLLEEEHGVLVNPRHYPTRWAHMFHAHLSNFRLLTARGEEFTHFVLLSSADLFFRHGAEAHLRGFDASQTGWAPIPVAGLDTAPGHWPKHLKADGHFLALLAARGHDGIMYGPHEGGFYARHLMEAMTQVLEGHFHDWDYNSSYPKEEFFLQTLLREHPGARLGHSLAHVLVIGSNPDRDRLAAARVLQEIGALDAEDAQPVDRWAREVLAQPMPRGDDPIRGRFVLSRIPRQPDNPLRQMLEQAASASGARRARALARRLSVADVLLLDRPGAKAQGTDAGNAASAWMIDLARDATVEPLITPAMGRGEFPIRLDACPDDFHRPLRITRGLSACAAHIPVGGAEARISLRPAVPLTLSGAALAQPSQAAFFFAYFDITLPTSKGAVLHVGLAPRSPPPREIWIEAHGGRQEKQFFPLGAGLKADKPGRVRLHPLPAELLALRDSPEKLTFHIYIAQGFGGPECRIRSLGWIAVEG